MKKNIRTLLAAAMLLAAMLPLAVHADTPVKSIVILYDNDVHCAIDGYAQMAGLRDAIDDTAYVALVSSGDYLQGGNVGAISRGGYIVDILRQMHYDAMTLGNHEFDYGVPRQIELTQQLNAPIVCVNLFDKDGQRVYAPYVIRTYGDRKVAFVGVVTGETEKSESYAFRTDGQKSYTMHTPQMVALVQHAVDEVREQGADYVILLSHMGEEPVEGYPTSHDMVAATNGIDVVLDGHSHNVIRCDTVLNRNGMPVYVTQTGSRFANVGKLVLMRNGRIALELIPTNQIAYTNADVKRVIDSIHTNVDAVTDKVIFHSDYKLVALNEKDQYEVRMAETNAGDLLADALRYFVDAELGFANGGSIRNDIATGDVTYGQVIDMLPYENHIVKIEATGAQVLEMLQQCTKELPAESGDFPQVSGIRFTIHVADHTVTDVEVLQADGSYKPIDPTAIYTIGTIDYCAFNGGFHNIFANCKVLQSSLIYYRDVLAPYINEVHKGTLPTAYAQPQGRISIK